MADSKHENDTNLDMFLDGTFAKLLEYSQLNAEVQVVCQLVSEMVNNVVKEAYPPDSGLTVREVIPVGSMAENTRIRRPDEFDFMVVLDKFQADDVTWIDSGSEGTLVRLKPKCRRENRVHALKKIGLCCFTTNHSCHCDCKSALLAEEMKTFQMIREVVYQIAEDGRSWPVESFPGKLRVMDGSTYQSGPAVTFDLLWETYGVGDQLETMEISIDLAPALELEINSFFVHRLDIFHQDYYKRLMEINKVHLVQHVRFREGVLQVSFALTEMQIIRDESETHKKCYMLLKYIYRTREDLFDRQISSYVFKNLVLQHAVQCEGGKLGWCLLKILVDLRDKLGDESSRPLSIPYTFSTKKKLLQHDESDHWRTDHRKELSELTENLEKFRNGSPIPSSFQFLMMKDSTPPDYSLVLFYHPGPFSECSSGKTYPNSPDQIYAVPDPNSIKAQRMFDFSVKTKNMSRSPARKGFNASP